MKMNYHSTNRQSTATSLGEVVLKSIADDQGLYMPSPIPTIDKSVIKTMKERSFHEIALLVAEALFGQEVPSQELARIVTETLSFDTPIVPLKGEQPLFSLELFHGPTLAFKDVGARFMARMLAYFIQQRALDREVNVLVATSGDTGSAVANGFLGVDGINVFVLYPKEGVSTIQEAQFTTLGENITALAVEGTFDDCQRLVKRAFSDDDLNKQMQLTSANSINIARLLPQSFYYFHAYAQLDRMDLADEVVVSVPSGNLGNLTAGLIAHRMGLPIKHFIAANNQNDIFCQYLRTGEYHPHPSIPTIANAMDVGDPSNFARIMELFDHHHAEVTRWVSGHRYDDKEIATTISELYHSTQYLLDPHGACAYQALIDQPLQSGETGLFLETAHPAKFQSTMERIIGQEIELPERLQHFMKRTPQTVSIGKSFSEFKSLLLTS